MGDEEQIAAAEAAAAEAAKQAEEAKAAAEKVDEPFDKDRALETIRKQRESEKAALDRAKALEARVQEYEDRDKTETQRTAEAREKAEKDAADARAEAIRLRVAMKHGLSEEDLDLLGTGDEEQIEARAKRLAELSAAKNGDEPRRRPQERLRSGVAPGAEPNEETEPGLPRLMQAYSQK